MLTFEIIKVSISFASESYYKLGKQLQKTK